MTDEIKAELKGREAFERFALAGRAVFTIRSKETGTRFTYRVRAASPADRNCFFVDYLGGADNENDWRFIGSLLPRRNAYAFFHSRKAKASADTPVVVAFGWTWSHPDSSKLEVWHEGRCGRCGRRLTVPESIASGLGPECATK